MALAPTRNITRKQAASIVEVKLEKPYVFNYTCADCPHQVRHGDDWKCHRYPPSTTNGLDELRPAALLPCGEHPDFAHDFARYMRESREQEERDETQLDFNAILEEQRRIAREGLVKRYDAQEKREKELDERLFDLPPRADAAPKKVPKRRGNPPAKVTKDEQE